MGLADRRMAVDRADVVAADGLLFLGEPTTWCWSPHESFATDRPGVLGDD